MLGLGSGEVPMLVRYALDGRHGRTEREQWQARMVGGEDPAARHAPLWDLALDMVRYGTREALLAEAGSFDLVVLWRVLEPLSSEAGLRLIALARAAAPHVLVVAEASRPELIEAWAGIPHVGACHDGVHVTLLEGNPPERSHQESAPDGATVVVWMDDPEAPLALTMQSLAHQLVRPAEIVLAGPFADPQMAVDGRFCFAPDLGFALRVAAFATGSDVVAVLWAGMVVPPDWLAAFAVAFGDRRTVLAGGAVQPHWPGAVPPPWWEEAGGRVGPYRNGDSEFKLLDLRISQTVSPAAFAVRASLLDKLPLDLTPAELSIYLQGQAQLSGYSTRWLPQAHSALSRTIADPTWLLEQVFEQASQRAALVPGFSVALPPQEIFARMGQVDLAVSDLTLDRRVMVWNALGELAGSAARSPDAPSWVPTPSPGLGELPWEAFERRLAGAGQESRKLYLCLPNWEEDHWQSLVLDFLAAHAPGDPVALVLLMPEDPRRAEELGDSMLSLLTEAGHDPEAVPDLELHPSSRQEPEWRAWLARAHAVISLGGPGEAGLIALAQAGGCSIRKGSEAFATPQMR